jgi:hypothetical protein
MRQRVGPREHFRRGNATAHRNCRATGEHEDRDAQFLHINKSVTEAMAANQPVISVDTKKKELVGNPVIAAKPRAAGVIRQAARDSGRDPARVE